MTGTTDHDRAADTVVVGTWVTADGYIRQQLLPDGRYDEARGYRRNAYTGRYTVTGSHLDYVEDTGLTATGDIRDGVLHQEHLVLHREQGSSRPVRTREGRLPAAAPRARPSPRGDRPSRSAPAGSAAPGPHQRGAHDVHRPWPLTAFAQDPVAGAGAVLAR